MSDVIIIIPTRQEAAYFAGHGLKAHICGVGMAECAAAVAGLLAEAVASGRKPDFALLAGIAGTCTDRLATGDTVAVGSETIVDLGRSERRRRLDSSGPEHYEVFVPLFQKTYTAGFIPESLPVARGHTVNTAGFSTTPSAASSGDCHPSFAGGEFPPHTPVIENMEGAAFFAVCERFGVRAAEIRTISNRVGEPVTPANLDLAARNLAAAVKKLLL